MRNNLSRFFVQHSLFEKIEETQSPPKVKKYYLLDAKRWIQWVIWGILILLVASFFGWNVYLHRTNQSLNEYALRYRILRMEQGYNNPTIAHLDSLFSSDNSTDTIRQLRQKVTQYEKALQRQAELALQQQRITEEQTSLSSQLQNNMQVD